MVLVAAISAASRGEGSLVKTGPLTARFTLLDGATLPLAMTSSTSLLKLMWN